MKTLKTKLGIEVDLYLDNIDNVNIKITASCEEGTKEFFIEHGLYKEDVFYVADQEDLIGYLMDEINLDVSAILKWADMVTVGFIAKDFAEYCVMKCTDEVEYRSEIKANGEELVVMISRYYKNFSERDLPMTDHYYGIKEIKNFLEEHKNGI